MLATHAGRLRSLLVLACLFVFGTPASAQFKKEKHPDLGIAQIERPRLFDPVPVQPDEKYVRLFYKERKGDKSRKSSTTRRWPPELKVLVIDDTREVGGKSESGDKSEVIYDLRSWAKKNLKGWRSEPLGAGKSHREWTTKITKFTHKPKGSRTTWNAYGYEWQKDRRTVALIGICAEEDYDELSALWRKVGDKLKLTDPADAKGRTGSSSGEGKWEKYYKYKRLSHPDYRVKVRDAMVKPWKAEDTDNFIVVFNTKDQPLVKRICREIEQMRLEYMKIFPPAGEFDAVSTVRVCKDKDEYIAYGGSPRSAGYWNYVTEELVLYDAAKVEKSKRPDDSDTFLVLYHEAFHQYIHYSTGELAPHSWFNEGFGDYFGGAVLKSGKVRSIGANPWRTWLIKRVVNDDIPRMLDFQRPPDRDKTTAYRPWEEMIRLSKPRFYADAAVCYAQAWSMIYFLRTSKEVKKNKKWAAILPTYFETLKREWAIEKADLPDDADDKALERARENAREAAVDEAFRDIDLRKIERAWIEFVDDVEDPREKKR